MIDKIKLIINNIHFKLLMFILRPQIRQKIKKTTSATKKPKRYRVTGYFFRQKSTLKKAVLLTIKYVDFLQLYK